MKTKDLKVGELYLINSSRFYEPGQLAQAYGSARAYVLSTDMPDVYKRHAHYRKLPCMVEAKEMVTGETEEEVLSQPYVVTEPRCRNTATGGYWFAHQRVWELRWELPAHIKCTVAEDDAARAAREEQAAIDGIEYVRQQRVRAARIEAQNVLKGQEYFAQNRWRHDNEELLLLSNYGKELRVIPPYTRAIFQVDDVIRFSPDRCVDLDGEPGQRPPNYSSVSSVAYGRIISVSPLVVAYDDHLYNLDEQDTSNGEVWYENEGSVQLTLSIDQARALLKLHMG